MKYILSLILFLISIDFAFAQWSVGIEGGLNNAKYSLTNLGYGSKLSNKNGFTIGADVQYKIIEQLDIHSGLRYDQKGGKVSHNYTNLVGDVVINFDYLEIPFHLVYAPFDIELKPILLGGINIGYLLSAKADLNLKNNIARTEDIENTASKFDIFLETGLGIMPKINDGTYYKLSVSYYYGVFDLDEYITTSGIHFLMGICFNL